MGMQNKARIILPHFRRLLFGGAAVPDAVDRALLFAPADDEADTDDADGGVNEERHELARGEGISMESCGGSLKLD